MTEPGDPIEPALPERWQRAAPRTGRRVEPENPRPHIAGLRPPREDSAVVLCDDHTDLDPPPATNPDAPWPLITTDGAVDWPGTIRHLRVVIGRDPPAATVARAA